MRPALAVLVAKATGSGLLRSYYKSDILLRALSLIGAFVFMITLLGRVGGIALALALCAGQIPYIEGPCLYPFQSAYGPLLICLACFSYTWSKQREQASSLVRYAGLGVLTGLLALWHGASFVICA